MFQDTPHSLACLETLGIVYQELCANVCLPQHHSDSNIFSLALFSEEVNLNLAIEIQLPL